MRALVTGGTGFIGSHVVRELLKQKIQVRCLIRASSKRDNLADLEVEYVIGDLTDVASLKMAVMDCQMLFHVAADYRLWASRPSDLNRVNVEGTRHLLQAAGEAGLSKIVYTSSVAAVGRPTPSVGSSAALKGGHESLEPTRAQLVGPYKQSKFASDQLAREFARKGLPIVIVNPSAPIGTRDIKPTPTGKMIVDFLNGRMPAYVDTGMNFVDVEDVAAGHWLASQKGRMGERYILGNKNMTLKNFLETVAAVARLPPPKFRIPYAVAWLAGAVSTALSAITRKEPAIPLDGVRMAHEPMYYDPSKAIRELGLPQTPVEDAIRKAVAWFQENGYIR
jgi:dihydroflavonol-4-reductase